ncbi:EAL domain-containing protein [Aquincola sp. S2]|uniref:EAL domain-containing protein n=1 Tax=Pseudaquabacterium terrae TaxID=2732868 RepID=A0ABX2EIV2_9BURK|nr:EAL domain-containing protein [Aquabacterium terrae]NRF68512.1 EAL domain-containing protein [Aquabacterium terrae]
MLIAAALFAGLVAGLLLARAWRPLLDRRRRWQHSIAGVDSREAPTVSAREALSEQGHILEMIATRAPMPEVLDRLVQLAESQVKGVSASILLLDNPDPTPLPAPGTGWSTPILSHSEAVLGSFVVHAQDGWAPTAHQRHCIESAARLAGIAIERQRSEQRIRHMAHHDELTGLPNRALLQDRMTQALGQARRTGRPLALLFLDLDGFKYINDSLGHEVGDRLLRAVAGRLQAIVRQGDTVARLGGDEFVVMLVDLPRADEAALVAHEIVQALSRPLRFDERLLHVTASLGLATFPADGDSAELLLKQADAAMYRAKAEGRNGFQCYTRDMGLQALQRVELQSALRLAVEHDQFELHYQPQVAPESGRIVAVEALLRWRHPVLGNVSPDRFIPLAEETGLIAPIGRWVLRSAGRQLQAWHAAGHTRLVMAVNLSARQFITQDIPQLVRETLELCGLPPQALELELTETALMHNAESVHATLSTLKAIGVLLALDDFGTGYSSLNHLRRFPIDTIKIDKSFTAEIATSDDTAAIVRAIVEMAGSLGVEIVAEGVEHEQQLRLLAALHCHRVQGYHIGRPMPAAELAPLLGVPDEPPSCDLMLDETHDAATPLAS